MDEPTFTSQALEFIRCNWRNVASVLGLVFSGLAAFFGERASTRAQQAREETRTALLSNSLAEEINAALQLASEIANLAEIGNHQALRFRSNDLHTRALSMLTRWEKTLSFESMTNLRSADAQLTSLRDETRKFAANDVPTARQLHRLQVSCGKIQDVFVQEHAAAMMRNDEEVNKWKTRKRWNFFSKFLKRLKLEN